MTMKKLLVIAMVVVLALSATIAVSAAPAVEGRKTITAYQAKITIDGTIDEAWQYAQEVDVDTVKENASSYFGDTSKVKGVDYADVKVRVLWDGDNVIYFLYIIKDNCISVVETAQPWEIDGAEIFLQKDNSTDPSGARIQGRVVSVPGNSNTYGVNEYAYGEGENGELIIEIKYNFASTIDVSNGNYIGIDFQYNDDAEGNGVRHACLGWSDSIDKASSDCTVYGQCELSTTSTDDLKAEEEAKKAAEEAAKKAEEEAKKAEDAPETGDLLVTALAAVAVAGFAVIRKKK